MSAKVHPLQDNRQRRSTIDHSAGKRFTRYDESSWSLEVEDDDDIYSAADVPSELEMADIPSSNRLLYYFQWLSEHPNGADICKVYLKKLAEEENSIFVTEDDTGLSVIHYVAAQWSVHVCRYLTSKGAQLDHCDQEGRTPLHIAAYFNHIDMIDYLLDNGADPNCKTVSKQTPIHFAVRGDSVAAIQLLIQRGAWYRSHGAVDDRGRTPLQLAAELDRNDAVLFLLSIEKKPAHCTCVDDNGHPALVTMILTMPKLASLGLDQLHKVYPVDRYQEYRLSRLETAAHTTISPFEAMVEAREYCVLTHPVMRKLLQVKWQRFGRYFFTLYFSIYLLFVLVWTALYSYPPVQSKHQYVFPTDIWRVVLEIILIILLVLEILLEVMEYLFSYERNKRYKTWLMMKLTKDIDICSKTSFFKSEKYFLEKSLQETKRLQAKYFRDSWNFIDITTVLLVIVTIVMHLFDIALHTEALSLWVARIGGVTVILVWFRLLYYARASEFLGPMVVIFGQVSGNIAQYLVIILSVFIPYVVVFWVLFGGEQQLNANITDTSLDLTRPHRVAVMLFRMTLVDDYPYDILRSIDELTSTVLVISFLFFAAVIGLNLFIALLSDTFQRVYDNAKANAEMQKAQLLLSMQDKASDCTRSRFFKYIKDKCSPSREHYEDQGEDDDYRDTTVTKISHQIYRLVKDFTEEHENHKNEFIELKSTVLKIEDTLSTLGTEVQELKDIITEANKKDKPMHGDNWHQRVHLGSIQESFAATHRNIPPLPPAGGPTLGAVGGTGPSLTERPSLRTLKSSFTKRGRVTYSSQASNPGVYQGHRIVRKIETNEDQSDEEEEGLL